LSSPPAGGFNAFIESLVVRLVPRIEALLFERVPGIRVLLATMRDLRAYDADVPTIAQYLAPSRYHMPSRR
jgi:hypothetical protein